MARLTFFPLGNADCCLMDLENKTKLLFDYANSRDPDNEDDLRIDLPTALREDLESADRSSFDVVAFSHLDRDHYQGASEFFYLEHAKKYQSEERVKIETMWVPAAVITEPSPSIDEPEGRIIQAEAKHRLKEGKGIRVFSRPERLKKWLEDNGIDPEERRHLITDAGTLVPGFTKEADGVEFFVHSPFARKQDDGTIEDRNDDSLILQATFLSGGVETKFVLSADAKHDTLKDIVEVTRKHGNDVRLEWDVFKLPHHCSYLSLGPEKGEDKTEPIEEVAWLFEEQGQDAAIAVSTSRPIPKKGKDADEDKDPPHRQAAQYYRDLASDKKGEFKVTMEHPTRSAPDKLVINIDGFKATVWKRAAGGAATVVRRRAPRVG